MAKKQDLLNQAKELGVEVTSKNTISEIENAIADAKPKAEAPQQAPTVTAKSGKRSAKALKEAEQKLEKIEHQKHKTDDEAKEEVKPKTTQKPTRTKLERRGKKYKKSAELIDASTDYSVKDAIELAKKTSAVKFDASVELHIRLGVDPKQADQNIRDNLILPAGTGKKVRVAVYADDEDIKMAKSAGADIAGSEDFLKQLDSGNIDFEVLVSTPKMMRNLSKYAKVLGPRGLMPNPKSGTVTTDVAKAVKEAKGGKVEYRVDSTGIIHLAIGKVSFSNADLASNIEAVFASVKAAKPNSLKSTYVNTIYMSTSMGPSIKIASTEL